MWFLRILRYVTFVDLSDAGGCAFLSFCTYSWVFHLFKKRRVRKDRNFGNVGYTSTADGERDINQKKLNWPFQIFSCDVPFFLSFFSFLFLLRFRARKNYSNRSRNRNYSSTMNRSENGTFLRRNISCIDWNLMENGKKLLIRISYPSFIKESFLIREIFCPFNLI